MTMPEPIRPTTPSRPGTSHHVSTAHSGQAAGSIPGPPAGDPRRNAPAAIGDIVDGNPPVPITVWYLPAPPAGDTVSLALAERLVMNYTHGRRLIVDLTHGHQLWQATTVARRRHVRGRPPELVDGPPQASLIVAGWPAGDATAATLLTGCAARLTAGGCAVVVLDGADLLINQVLIAAARAAGLTYLQHIVAAHAMTRTGHDIEQADESRSPAGVGGRSEEPADGAGAMRDGGRHPRVHTDMLVFSRHTQSPSRPGDA